MANLRTGLGASWTSPVAETTYGVVPSLATAKFVAAKSDTLELKKTAAQGIGILSQRLYPQSNRRVVTNWTAGGTLPMDCPTRGLQQWLFPMFGSYGQTASALAQDGTTGAYKAVHAPGALEGNSFSLQKGAPAVDTGAIEPVTYCGCKIADWELSVKTGEIAQLVFTIDARNELAGAGNSDPLNASVPVLQAFAPPATTSGHPAVFHFREASVFTGGTVTTTSGVTSVSGATLAASVMSCSIKHTVPLNTTRFLVGNSGFKAEQLQNGLRKIAVSLVVEWLSSEAFYNAYAADTVTTLQLQFLGESIGTGSDFSTLTILVPDLFLDGESPKVPGETVITQTLPMTGLDDAVNNVIQATYWTLDPS